MNHLEYLVALRYVSGLSDEEIANKTGEDAAAVNAKILKFLKEYGKKISSSESRSPSHLAAVIEAFKKEHAGFQADAGVAPSDLPLEIQAGIPHKKMIWNIAGGLIALVLLLSAGAYGFVRFFFASEPIDEMFEKQILSQIRGQEDFKKLKAKTEDGRMIVTVTRENGAKQRYFFVSADGKYLLKRFEKL